MIICKRVKEHDSDNVQTGLLTDFIWEQIQDILEEEKSQIIFRS